jgi:hypothetical protein
MHQSWRGRLAQASTMIKQRIEQRIRPMARRRMDDDAGGFIQDQTSTILEQNLQ